MEGCKTKLYQGRSRVGCAMKCLETKICPSFVYNSTTSCCEICADGYTVTGLNFSTGSGTYLLRNVHELNRTMNNVDEVTFNFSGTFSPGELLYLRAVQNGNRYWWINLGQSSNTLLLHMRRRNDGRFGNPYHALNTLLDGVWANETYVPDFPYVDGKSFELHILFQSIKALIHFNRQFICTFNNEGRISMEEGRYLSLFGDLLAEVVDI
nr:LEG6 protein [Biomphalaria glabrata]